MVILMQTTLSLQVSAFTAEMNSHKFFNIYLDKYLIFGKGEGTDQMAGQLQREI